MSTTETAVQLAAARTALHQLMTGTAVVSITDPSGRRVEFSATNADELRAYIRELQAQTGSDGVPVRREPFGVTW